MHSPVEIPLDVMILNNSHDSGLQFVFCQILLLKPSANYQAHHELSQVLQRSKKTDKVHNVVLQDWD